MNDECVCIESSLHSECCINQGYGLVPSPSPQLLLLAVRIALRRPNLIPSPSLRLSSLALQITCYS